MTSLLSVSLRTTAQATAVWLSKEIPEDERYKTSELLGELSLKLHDYIHHKTGADHRIHYYHVQFTAHIYISHSMQGTSSTGPTPWWEHRTVWRGEP